MDFRPIRLEDKSLIEHYVRAWGLINSSYTFTNLFIWGHSDNILIAEEQNVLYIMFCFGGRINLLAPIPESTQYDYEKAVNIGADYLKSIGKPVRFAYASESIYEAFSTQCHGAHFELDRGNCDYIYNSADLITLSGKHFHAKRNFINRFHSIYPDYSFVRITPDMEAECASVFSEWLHNKNVLLPGMEGEGPAITRLIRNMDTLSVFGGGIKVRGRLIAASFGELITPKIGLVHIEKANDLYSGIYPMINQSFSNAFFGHTELINREEDMDIEGLRKSKLSYHPKMLIEKYTVSFEEI
ncbi:MAG: DUF2156 domain-containing protein [Clostridia bacterium]|nr:DUF2156 domain-containing protein [Clostridia bacterium]